MIGKCPPARVGACKNDGKELDPLTKVQSEDLGGSETDRFKDTRRSNITHMIDDFKGGKKFLTSLRQQRAFLDTKEVDLTDLPFQKKRWNRNGLL